MTQKRLSKVEIDYELFEDTNKAIRNIKRNVASKLRKRYANRLKVNTLDTFLITKEGQKDE